MTFTNLPKTRGNLIANFLMSYVYLSFSLTFCIIMIAEEKCKNYADVSL